jgi:hypothetical protein
MKSIQITSIDWQELAKRYNELFQKNISFQGSSAEILEKGEKECEVRIELYVSTPNETPSLVYDTYSNTYRLYYDNDNKLCYTSTNSSKRPPMKKANIAIGYYELIGINTDYIQPFIESL